MSLELLNAGVSSRSPSKAICVLGMHRSGTSAVTRAINLLGAYLGDERDLMPPLPDNPEGFWERSDICNLHDRLLASLKRTWDTVDPLPERWHLSDEARPFKEEIRELIVRHFSGRSLWAWKDPRACLLFPLWRQVLEEQGVELACVLAIRNPLDVAISLHKRNGISIGKAFGIWFNHNVVGLHNAAGLSTAFLSYDAFLEGWAPELRRCAEVVGIDWPADETPLREGMNAFLRPYLRHSLSSLSDLHAAPALVRDLYLLLLEQTRRFTAPDSALTELVDGLYRDYDKYAYFFTGDLDNLFACESRFREYEEKMSHLKQAVAHSGATLSEREGQLSECRGQLSEYQGQLSECRGQLSECRGQLSECRGQLSECERQLSECRQLVKVIFNSMSWKVTSPFRRIFTALGTFRK